MSKSSETILSISSALFILLSERLLISFATTANPFPCSPALAASMDALRERRLVWSAIDCINSTALLIASAEVCVLNVSSFNVAISSEVFSLILTSSLSTFDVSLLMSFIFSTVSDNILIESVHASISLPILITFSFARCVSSAWLPAPSAIPVTACSIPDTVSSTCSMLFFKAIDASSR